MIRTGVVDLTVIPAIAYRQKLPAGGSGVVILRSGVSQPGIASISKTSGEAIPSANTPADKYPKEAFAEALELTAGMPYKKLGGVKLAENKTGEIVTKASTVGIITGVEYTEESDGSEEQEAVIVDSEEYRAIVSVYTDKNGKLSYDLINRDMIKFAHSDGGARRMIEEMQSVEDIRAYVVCAKFREITANKDLTDAQAREMLDMLDEVSPKGVLKEFNDEIRLKLRDSKRS